MAVWQIGRMGDKLSVLRLLFNVETSPLATDWARSKTHSNLNSSTASLLTDMTAEEQAELVETHQSTMKTLADRRYVGDKARTEMADIHADDTAAAADADAVVLELENALAEAEAEAEAEADFVDPTDSIALGPIRAPPQQQQQQQQQEAPEVSLLPPPRKVKAKAKPVAMLA